MISKRKTRRTPSRNAVLYKAHIARPTTAGLQERISQCPFCEAPEGTLCMVPVAAHRMLNYSLACMGISSLRWMRNKLTIECSACGSSFCDAPVFNWNFAIAIRRYADYGMTSFPVPYRKTKRGARGLSALLTDNLHPSKRTEVNPRLRKRLMRAPARATRLALVRDARKPINDNFTN